MTTDVTFPRTGTTFAPLADDKKDGHVHAHALQTINADPMSLYKLWRNETMLPIWQEGVVSVTRTGDTTSHWVVQMPGVSAQAEFDSEIIQDQPGEHISWRVIAGQGEGTTGDVTFSAHPAGHGTVVTLINDVVVAGGVIGNAIAATASRSPRQVTIENLRHFKQLAESGEIPRTMPQPHGPRGVIGKWKEFLMGETNPVPPGTSEHEQSQDYPTRNEFGEKETSR